jgi:hypothetical protein
MRRPVVSRAAPLVALAGLLLGTPGAAQLTRPPVRPKTTTFVPRFEVVAETRPSWRAWPTATTAACIGS